MIESCLVWLALLYHSPATPLGVCSFQSAHAGRSLCIPTGGKLHQTRQAVGRVPVMASVFASCILLCVMDKHKGHDTVLAASERKDKQLKMIYF